MLKLIVGSILLAALVYGQDEINGYHFHTYYFQKNNQSKAEVVTMINSLSKLIAQGNLSACSLDTEPIDEPIGPHPMGMFFMCCNHTSIDQAISWYMQNRGNHSVFMHPLTRYEVEAHTAQAMWLGTKMPLDLSALSPTPLPAPEVCSKSFSATIRI